MQDRRGLSHIFLFFLIFSILIFFLFKLPFLKPVSSFTQNIFAPVESVFHNILSFSSNAEIKKIKEENLNITQKLISQSKIQADNKALRDQFAVEYPKSQNLLSVNVIGSPSFIPGVTVPEYLILDRGSNDGIKDGMAVVYKDNLVGKIDKVFGNKSSVLLITNTNFTLTSVTLETKALGVVKGRGGGEIILDNVVLSDSLKTDDFVLSKGDAAINGSGILPNLVIGKIVSINKNPSSLFQTAKIQTLLDVVSLKTIFVVKNF